jgi:hypothetical protein
MIGSYLTHRMYVPPFFLITVSRRTRGRIPSSYHFGSTGSSAAVGGTTAAVGVPRGRLIESGRPHSAEEAEDGEDSARRDGDRDRRQTTVQCRFGYGMTGSGGGGCGEACTMNVPNTWFTNLKYGLDANTLACGLPADQVRCAPITPHLLLSPPPLRVSLPSGIGRLSGCSRKVCVLTHTLLCGSASREGRTQRATTLDAAMPRVRQALHLVGVNVPLAI